MMYVVSYTLNPKRDATPILVELQRSPEWWHYLDETWLISTYETVTQLHARIIPRFIATDRVLIVQVTSQASYQGWLPKDAWDWFRERRYK